MLSPYWRLEICFSWTCGSAPLSNKLFGGINFPLRILGRRSDREYAKDVGEFVSNVSCRQEPIEAFLDSFTRLNRGSRIWNGPDPEISLFSCSVCITPRQWGSLETALLRPLLVCFAWILSLWIVTADSIYHQRAPLLTENSSESDWGCRPRMLGKEPPQNVFGESQKH